MRLLCLFFVGASTLAAPGPALAAQSAESPSAVQYRTVYLLRSCGVRAPPTPAASVDPATAAWAVLCAAQLFHASGARMAALAARTDTLVVTRPTDPWAWLARAGALLGDPARAPAASAAVDTLWLHAGGHPEVEPEAVLVLADHALLSDWPSADSLAGVVAMLDQHPVARSDRAGRVAWLALRGEALTRLGARRQRDSSAELFGRAHPGLTSRDPTSAGVRPTGADTLQRAAAAAFAEARGLAPTDPLPDYREGLAALASRYTSEHGALAPVASRLAVLQHAATLAPDALGVHRALWELGEALNAEWHNEPARRQPVRDVVARDWAAVRARHPHDPGVLAAVAEYACRAELHPIATGCAELRAQVLRDFPQSEAARAVLFYSWKALSDSATSARYGPKPLIGERRAAYLAAAHAYLVDAPHGDDPHLAEFAYWFAPALYGDTVVAPSDLVSLLHELVPLALQATQPATYPIAPSLQRTITLLADRRAALPEAGHAARTVLDAAWGVVWDALARLASRRDPHLADSVSDLVTGTVVRYADAAGWTLAQQGDLAEGARLLRLSTTLDSTAGAKWPAATAWYHLGEVALRQGDSAAAMQDYQIALAREATDMDWILPHKEAVVPMLPADSRIRALYAARHQGDTTGVADALAGDSVHARAALLATRLAAPEPLPRFRLVSLDGRTVSSDSLRGKVAVINGWGIWCGWCVAELPDYQRLYERYKTDPDVVILTIDREEDSTLTADSVRAYAARRGWTFPVLMDADHYIDSARVNAFPSTVFVDRQGRVAFRKDGYSKYLEREFTWRIEALKREPRPTTSAIAPSG